MARRAQGTAAGLSRERIAAVGVDLVDRHGLDKFGVRRLAEELGVDPMSIYHHIKGKAALLDAVSEAVLTEVVVPAGAEGADGRDWEELARRTAHSYRDMAHRHRRVFPLLTTRPQTSPVALAALERLVASMRAAELPEQVVADTQLTLFGFLNGYLLAVLSGSGDDGVHLPVLDPGCYPTMTALLPLQTGFGSVAEFDRILDTVLAGIKDRAARGTTP
ncbi:TetR/AcrR family transcriptional regulator [Streptomyces endophyticus]|uniref:TetR/AcrR family transcriptional regulator C-terminal domain-containing protein n=1 Tax=Streptomyces endophyticus TaxID=714166 RepID=A0ABU6EXF1_9ACTN|nr:TetR/AcrR family transcriptional regulator C-terminal domain-containing protein [Streptomyces endophyticus]MEB8336410.1 TetR/AcrR family transcriptional regulator C-terminal domain-containing protein [Streptomyces endophyticus]